MTAEEIAKCVQELDDLVLEANTNPDRQESLKALRKAIRLACKLVTAINRDLKYFVEESFDSYKGIPVSVSSWANKPGPDQENLRIFRSGKEFSDFMDALGGLLRAAGYSKDFVERATDECYRSFSAMSQCSLDPYFFRETFEQHSTYFCEQGGGLGGDDSGGGGPKIPKPPKPTGPGGRDWIRLAIQALATIAAIWGHDASGGKTDHREVLPPPPPPITQPYQLKLLALLLYATLGKWLDDAGLITIEKSRTGDPVGQVAHN